MSDDKYESRYMDGGSVRYREKHVSRIFVGSFLALALAIAGVGFLMLLQGHAAIAGSLIPFSVSGLIAMVGLYFAVMRITVSNTHLAVAYGTLGTQVPLSAITSAKLENRVGLGPKYDGKGWNYGPLGTSRGVRVEWSEGGSSKTCYVGASNPEALLKSIEEARAGSRLRIDDSTNADAAIEAEAMAEAEAAVEAPARRQDSTG